MHHRQAALKDWGGKTRGNCIGFKAQAPSQLRTALLQVYFWLLWVCFGFIKKQGAFVEAYHRTISGGPAAGNLANWQVPQKDTASAAFDLLQLQMDVQPLKFWIQKHAENKPQLPLPSQIRLGEAPHS